MLPVFLAALAPLALAQYPGAKKVPGVWEPGFKTIKVEDAKEILGYLAGPTFNGRSALNGDWFAAAGYVATYLRGLGLQPGGDKGSYLRRFTLLESTVIPAETSLKSDDGVLSYPYGVDFSLRSSEDGKTPVKFAFVHAPPNSDLSKLDWNSVKGRWIVFSAGSRIHPFLVEILTRRNQSIVFDQPVNIRDLTLVPDPLRAQSVKDSPDPRVPKNNNIGLSNKAVEEIAKKSGAVKFLAKSPTEPSIEIPDTAFTVTTKVANKETPAANVVAVLPGVDPVLRDECVLVGSHLDHFGPSPDGVRFGADDNGSGCTANMLLARAISTNPTKPKRTVVFAFWTMEETGTYGSFAYSAKPVIPIEKTVAYVNMDMVGRNEEYTGDIPENNVRSAYPGIVKLNSPDFLNLLTEMNAFVNLRLKNDKEDRTERSDTRNFVFRGVPTVKVFTGEHRDYHRATDTPDKVNYEKLTNVAKWVYLTVEELASNRTRPKYVKTAWGGPPDASYQGHVQLPIGTVLPKDAKLTVELVDTSLADAPAKLVETFTAPADSLNIPFEITLAKTRLNEKATYRLQFRIQSGKSLLFVNDEAVTVLPAGWIRPRDIVLKKV